MWVMGTMGVLMPSSRPARLIEKGDPRTLQVRARVREHLVRFRDDYCNASTEGIQHGGLGRIIATPDMDYQFRAYISPEDFSTGLAGMVAAIDWMKFKPQIEKEYGDHKLHSFYNSVWSVMLSQWRVGSSYSTGRDRRTNPAAERRIAARRASWSSGSWTSGSWGTGVSGGSQAARTVSPQGQFPPLFGSAVKTFNEDGSVLVDHGGHRTLYAAGSWVGDTLRVESGREPVAYPVGTSRAPVGSTPLAERLAAEEPDLFETTEATDEELLDGILDDLGADDEEPSDEELLPPDASLDDPELISELVEDSYVKGSFLSEYHDEIVAAVQAAMQAKAASLSAGSAATSAAAG